MTPLSESERFVQARPGTWTAVFVKATKKVAVLSRDAEEPNTLVKELIARGITRRSAQELIEHHPNATIREKIRMFDAMRSGGGEGKIRNRAGWLYSAIVHDYAAPGTDKHRPQPTPLPAAKPQAVEAGEDLEPKAAESPAFDAFWAALSEGKQVVFEEEAVAAAPAFLQRQYCERRGEQGSLWRVIRQRILLSHFLAAMDGQRR